MCRKFLPLFSFLLIFFLSASTAYSNDQTVFGPKDFRISKLHFHFSSHRFASHDSSFGIITIKKNTHGMKVKEGFLLFNGKFVPLNYFLIGRDLVFEKEVVLHAKNRLTFFCRGTPGASVSIQVRKKNSIQAPGIRFSVDPQSITLGESSVLQWDITDAEIVSIDGGIGYVSAKGSASVSPQQSTTYTLKAEGPGGTATQSVTVMVKIPLPVITIRADPDHIRVGESSTLSWTSAYADSCILDPDIGEVDLNGKIVVSPVKTVMFILTAINSSGQVKADAIVTIVNNVPVAEAQSVVADEDTPVSLTLSGSDADDDPLTYQIISSPMHGVLTGIAPNLTYTPTSQYNGSDAFNFAVDDGNSCSEPAMVAINIRPVNDAPVAADDFVATDEDLPVTTSNVLVNDTDLDGDLLSISSFTQPAGGTLTGNGNGTFTYRPNQNFNGTDSFIYTVTDGNGGVDTATVRIAVNPANDLPTANEQIVSLDEDTTTSIILTAIDPDSDVMNYRVVSGSNHGKITGFPPNLTYTPDADFNGQDAFTFVVNDGIGDSESARVDIIVSAVNDTPVAVAGEDQAVPVGQTVTIDGGKSSDVDGDSLIYNWSFFSVPVGSSSALSVTSESTAAFVPDIAGVYTIQLIVNDQMVDSEPDSVIITAGSRMVEVPGVVGLSQIQAEAAITDAGLRIGSIDSEHSEFVPEGFVISQNPGAGIIVEANSPVEIVVSLGPVASMPTVFMTANPEIIPVGQCFILSWQSCNSDSASIDNGIGSVDVNGSITLSPTQTTIYTIEVRGPGGTATASVKITVNHPPAITVIEPKGIRNIADNRFAIKWVDADPDDNAAVSLYYDTDNSGADGTLIAGGLNEDPDEEGGNEYAWDTTEMAEGVYYVYAVINDGVNEPVIDYSDGKIDIKHPVSNEFKLTAWDAAAGDNFGTSVAINGDYAIVGAKCDDDYGNDSGSAYIFKREGFFWTGQTKLTVNKGYSGEYDNFGNSVGISGDYAIVGSKSGDHSGYYQDTGSAFIFKREDSNWTEQAKLAPNPVSGGMAKYDDFGESVAISGDYAIVGAPGDDDGVAESGAAYIFKREGETWIEQAKLKVDSAQINENFGCSVAISGDYAIVGAADNDDGGDGSGAAYIFKREGSGWVHMAELKAGDAETGDRFGTSVDINDTYAIAGAYGDDDRGNASGAVYVFERNGERWNEQAKLIADDASDGDRLGCSVAISGDYIIAGSNGDNDAGNYSGSSYIFKRDGDTWTQQGKLTAGDASAGDNFGTSVAISGDYAIVGAYGDDDGGSSSGSGYVYSFLPVNIEADPRIIHYGESCNLLWILNNADGCSIDPDIGIVEENGTRTVFPTETTTYTISTDGSKETFTDRVTVTVFPNVSLTANPNFILTGESSTLSWATFGADSVSIDHGIGDVPAKGSISVAPASGQIKYTLTATGPGGTAEASATVHVLDSSTLGELKLSDIDPAAFNKFGYSVAISGDYAVVGANGSAFIFKREGFGWSVQTELTAGDTATNNRFGYSVAISGDYAIVGAYLDNDGGGSSGAAYVFRREGSSWIEQAKLTAGDAEDSDYFGCSVAISGDFAIVGAYGDDDYGSSSGAAYIFKREGSSWIEQAKLTAGDAATSDYFGSSVAISGDFAIVGAYGDDDGGSSSGAAYVFRREGSGWIEQAKLVAGDAAAEDFFGYSVSIRNEHAVVGAYGDDDYGGSSGAVYVFKRVGTVWTEQAKLTASTAQAGDSFGYSVAVSGDELVVGAPGDSDGGHWSGSIYIFRQENSVWNQEIKIRAADADPDERFGFCVAVSDDDVIAGAWGDSEGGCEAGAAYIYSTSCLPPGIDIRLVPEKIEAGEHSILTWNTAHADTCTIEPGIGSVDVNGSISVSPIETTAYTITATGLGGVSDASVTLTVSCPKPSVDIAATPILIEQGEFATLSWSSSNAQSAEIDHGIGEVSVNGSLDVFPAAGAIYTITVAGPGGTSKDSVRIYVGNGDEYAYGNPTPAEQAHLEAINRARMNPQKEAERLGIDLFEGVADGMISGTPVQPLTFNVRLLQAANLHSRDMIDRQYYAHNCPDGRTPSDRLQEVGYHYSFAAENIACFASDTALSEIDTILGFHDLLFKDAGNEGRMHRVNILNQHFKEAGLGGAIGPYDGHPYCCMFTCDLGASSRETKSFLLGVVYDDQNHDGIYSAGEGIGDVEILILESGFATWTASAGGYGFPLPPGSYHVEAVLPDGRAARREISIGDQNVKVDFLAGDFEILPPAVMISADPATIREGEVAVLKWTSIQAESCIIEPDVGSVNPYGSITVSPMQTTTYTITAAGPGGSSEDCITIVVMPPSPSVTISADPEIIQVGGSSVLSWDSTFADTCSIEPGIGNVEPNGTLTVSPTETTSYRINATGPGGTATDLVTVSVINSYGTVNGTVISSTSGQPIEGVLVSAADRVQVQTARTDTSGGFEIEHLVPGEITIRFAREGYISFQTTFTIDEGQSHTMGISLNEIQMPGKISLSGLITDAVTGQPLAQAMVSVTDAEKTQTAETMNDGAYSIGGIEPGSVEITASRAGYASQTRRCDLHGQGIFQVDFELYNQSEKASVHGVVTNAKTLMPEPGVSLTVEGTDISCVTNEDGVFTLTDVPMGERSFNIIKEEFVETTVRIDIDKTQFQLDLVFPITNGLNYPAEIHTNITGYVYDALTGRPLINGIVKVFGSDIQTSTDTDGQYTLTDLPLGKIQLIAMALDHKAVSVYLTVEEGGADHFHFSLSPTTRGKIAGSITDADTGEPIPCANLSLGEDSLLGAQSKADGRYTILGVPAGSHTVTVTHPAYQSAATTNVVVVDGSTTTLDFVMTRRPVTGSLEGVITDMDTGDPVVGAILKVEGSSTTATDGNGYYLLSDLSAGLVDISIDAAGYPLTERTTAVTADQDDTTPTITTADFKLDAFDSSPPDSISAAVSAETGGSIESPDGRFMVVIPPGALSGDAIVTLMTPLDAPEEFPGDELILDPELGVDGIRALGKMTRVVLEPETPGDEIPTLNGWVILIGRYFQSQVDELNIEESSIFPYYWDGTQWTVMQIKPYETAVDEMSNQYVAVVNFSITETGDPVTAALAMKEPVLLASLSDYIPNLEKARTFLFRAAGAIRRTILIDHNVDIYDKDYLDAVKNTVKEKIPNENALPLLVIHGWDPLSILKNVRLTDPNTDKRYRYIMEDLVEATNGVYRPMFATYNSRAGIVSNGNDLATCFESCDVKGRPAEPGVPDSGKFWYFDTFGYSMGGLISRCLQSTLGGVNNMVIVGTPNHGTHSVLKYMDYIPRVGEITMALKFNSPGTKDLCPYDDQAWFPFLSGNPTLYCLNRSPKCIPLADMTLIAGTHGFLCSRFLLGENDKVVTVDSVFCRTDKKNDGDESLLVVSQPAKKYEYTEGFNHFNFGGLEFRIKDHPKVKDAITKGLSDWVVGKSLVKEVAWFDDNAAIKNANFKVRVEYNSMGRDFDRVALVIYAQDEKLNWHVCGDYVDNNGNIIRISDVTGNSQGKSPCIIETDEAFKKEEGIRQVVFELVPLEPGQESVPLEPRGNFELPGF